MTEEGYDITDVSLRGIWHDSVTRSAGMTIGWSARGIGFGEISLTYDRSEQIPFWRAETETMSKEFVRAVLGALVSGCIITDGAMQQKKD